MHNYLKGVVDKRFPGARCEVSYESDLNLLEWLGNTQRIPVRSCRSPGQKKIFQANLMKRHITTDTASDETPMSDGSVPAASLADDDKGTMIVAVTSYRSSETRIARRQ
ncbi:hypothetical protein PoB_001725600 [Plakobranchus ocellatus]|uniref:Uncharacterized protein n=1 Tax=Plakobranchus ocellatus TaxID=259542 RepID=A0AAV3Z4G7_9GAST|nr:hypothetical protein PoB_001725600 [Plakobranchus ocellatus]